MNVYFAFADEMSINHLPPSPDEVRLFAAWLMLTHCSKESSLRQYLSALKTYCAIRGLFVPSPTEYPPLAAVVRGAARSFPGLTRRGKPVTPAILVNLVRTKPPAGAGWRARTTLQVYKDTAIILFFSMLRGSNIFPDSLATVNKIRQLTWDKIRRVDNGVVITVLLSKTVQFGEKLHEIPLVACPGSEFCPVGALDRLLQMRGGRAAATDLVLQLPGPAGNWGPLLKHQFIGWFKGRISAMGLDATFYFCHSFRHGSIALALLHHDNVTLIKLHSNHISDCIMTYSQIPAEKRTAVYTAMLNAVHDHAAAALHSGHGN